MRTEIIGTVLTVLFTIISSFIVIALYENINMCWWGILTTVVVVVNIYFWSLLVRYFVEKISKIIQEKKDGKNKEGN